MPGAERTHRGPTRNACRPSAGILFATQVHLVDEEEAAVRLLELASARLFECLQPITIPRVNKVRHDRV